MAWLAVAWNAWPWRVPARDRPPPGGRRITLLRRRLKEVSRHRATRRKQRERSEVPTVALAGYTNVGKSTLLNRLTDAGVSVNDRLFETLDPTTRGFEYDGRRYLVTDTVGFIRRLPHDLVEGFAATLEETLRADLVLHVVDASVSEEQLEAMAEAVESVLAEIGADELPGMIVANKIDLVDPLGAAGSGTAFPERRRFPRTPARASRSFGPRSPRTSPSGSKRYGSFCPTRRAASSRSCTSSERRSTSGSTSPKGSSCERGSATPISGASHPSSCWRKMKPPQGTRR